MTFDFTQQVINEFRANEGRVGGWLEGARLLLLTSTGARTGRPHTVPLGYLPDGAERTLVIGSAGGAPRHPAWFHNVLADPRVQVESGAFHYAADAAVITGAERDRLFARAVEADPGWGQYEVRSGRTLPVVALYAVPGPPQPTARTTPGRGLALLHDAFRRELALIRAEVAASGAGLGTQLRVNCLTLCQGLSNHHGGEDIAMFPALARSCPELAPTIDRLSGEHERIAALLAQLQAVLDAPAADPTRLLAEVDRLVDALEAHLTYEEEQLIPVLDALMPA
ncbi:nitroreductase/quinone reductase family protein [Pseudonocardia sp. GCM10023141]|uniref:nitroreductase/quinone reductase family protein n=1 Tax=Pseudonocardia sp. GCM10023141 TaxID=3252653 RepID=UPI00361A1B7E